MAIESRVLQVERLKKGLSTTHPLRADEIKIIKTWLKERVKMELATNVFL
jgi:type 1 fimbriae regulatory protein FimB